MHLCVFPLTAELCSSLVPSGLPPVPAELFPSRAGNPMGYLDAANYAAALFAAV